MCKMKMRNNDRSRASRLVQKGLMSRRELLQKLGWAGVFALIGGTGYASLRFIRPGVLYEPPGIFEAGTPDDYTEESVSDIWSEEQNVWMVRSREGLYALISSCTHLGCGLDWSESEQLFKCPCHGSTFTREGDVVSGPAPEPLYRAPLKLLPDGKILAGNGLLGIRLASQANRNPQRSEEAFVLHY
jgi:cytochrome b6-f complex iron-sulfur subunit